jgi:hypothetical protein
MVNQVQSERSEPVPGMVMRSKCLPKVDIKVAS